MKDNNHFNNYLNSIFLSFTFIFCGCSIFKPVGDIITRGYDNTVSYFNVYYNASRIFSEAEDEIKTAEKTARSKSSTNQFNNQTPQISGTARQKFSQVIDKCSYILAFYPASSLVDNSLFLIGKSFYYQMEYMKAERKFEELIAQYPKSSLTLEAKLWNARTKEKLGNLDEAIKWCETTIEAAIADDDKEIESQARLLNADILNNKNEQDKAIKEYEIAIELSDDDEMKSKAQMNMANIYFGNGKYAMAAAAFLKVGEYTSDIYLNYFCNLQAAIAFREIGEYDKGIEIINSMIEDFRNKEYLPSLLYERANDYVAVGKLYEAIEEYNYVDTTYKNTEHSTMSAYQLGKIYIEQEIDYELAFKYFTKVSSSPATKITQDGKSRQLAFTRYFDARRKIAKADSLLFIFQEKSKEGQVDSINISNPDTLINQIANIDSVQTTAKKIIAKPIILNIDSINGIKSVAAQELGDIFYSDILVPDSAFYWYNQSLTWEYNPKRSPRILYILAEHSRRYPEMKYPLPEEYYQQLDRDFPETIYAIEARRFIGKEKQIAKVDSAALMYQEAEKLIETNNFLKAISSLSRIAHLFPKSEYSAKSGYAIAWIYEHRLNKPESALVYYKKVEKEYSGTTYASAAGKRTFDESKIDTSKQNAALQKEQGEQSQIQDIKEESEIDEKDIKQNPPDVFKDDKDGRRGRTPFRKPADRPDR